MVSYRHPILLYLAIIFFLISCVGDEESPKYKSGKNLPLIDSFWVKGLDNLSSLDHYGIINDSIFFSFNGRKQRIKFFKNKGNANEWTLYKDYPLGGAWKNSSIYFFALNNKNHFTRFYVFDNNSKSLIVYHDSLKVWTHHSSMLNLPKGKNEFGLWSDSKREALIKGDTLTTTYMAWNVDGLKKYYKEDLFWQFLIGDSIKLIRTFGKPPMYMSKYSNNGSPLFCFAEENLYMVFPYSDSLYCYNVSNGNLIKKIDISNPDYITPDQWPLSLETGTQAKTLSSKRTHYTLNSFIYLSIQYSPSTHHLVLFYTKPEESSAENGSRPDPRQKNLYALVLNNQFEKISYYKFEKGKYFLGFYTSTDKGILMPYFNNKIYNETNLRFDLFRF